jgi:hypothetical protein
MRQVRKASIAIISGIVFMALICFEAAAFGGQETRSVREVSGFERVSFSTRGELIITQGDREALEIEALPSDLPQIVTEVRDGTLYIGRQGAEPFSPFQAPVFRLTMKKVAVLETHSSGRISLHELHTDSLRVLISSSGNIAIDSLAAESLEVRISSSGSLRVAGIVNRQDVLLSSSGSYSGGQLASSTASVRASSSGTATLRVSDSLDALVTSSGNVRYYGNPRAKNFRATSSGRIVRLGN